MTYFYIADMVFDALVCALVISSVITSCYAFISTKQETKKYSNRHIFFVSLYFNMLFYVTVFRADFIQDKTHSINYIPFVQLFEVYQLQESILGYSTAMITLLYNVLGNIVWFFPLGMLIKRKNDLSLTQLFAIAFSVSLIIEILQYILYSGISDIDDIIFNVLGAMIGYLVTRKKGD